MGLEGTRKPLLSSTEKTTGNVAMGRKQKLTPKIHFKTVMANSKENRETSIRLPLKPQKFLALTR